jgi:hypothetical protein
MAGTAGNADAGGPYLETAMYKVVYLNLYIDNFIGGRFYEDEIL